MLVDGLLFLAVGEVGKIGDFEVEAVESDNPNCNGCVLRYIQSCFSVFGPCDDRPDGKNVVFIIKETDGKH